MCRVQTTIVGRNETPGASHQGSSLRARGRIRAGSLDPRRHLAAVILLAPATLGFLVFYLVPAVRGVGFSLTDSTLLKPGEFVGLANYQAMIADDVFWNAVRVTAIYVVINIGSQTVFALGLAVAMDRLTRSTVVRALMLVPWLVPGVTAGLLWLYLLDPTIGVVNEALAGVGLPRQGFLSSPEQSMPTIALINTWRYLGYTALLIFAGLQQIPQHLYEAAALDGAGEIKMFRSLTLPLLRPVLIMVILVTTIGSFQVFDLIVTTTEGGPVDSTRALYVYIFAEAFERLEIGYGSAMAVSFMIVMGIASVVSLRLGRANRSDLDSA